MHYFKDSITDSELLLNNLRLLNYDLQEANQTFRLSIEELNMENVIAHPKLLIHIIHFIVQKTINEEEFCQAMKQFYPPRSQLEQSVYKQEIAKYLKNHNKIPKNFIVTKTMLDTKIFQFLRFMSEFGLREQFFIQFPQKQLKTIFPDPFKILIEDRPCINELNDMFIYSSYHFDPHHFKMQIPQQILKNLTAQCGYLILKWTSKLKKVLTKNCELIESIEDSIFVISADFKMEREKSLKLVQQLQNFKNSINQGYLTQERKLDRKPQLDLSFRTFNGMNNILKQYQELRMDHNMSQMQSTTRLDKFDKENNLNKIQEIQIMKLDGILYEIDRIEQQTWIQDRAKKVQQSSQQLLQELKQIEAKFE